MASNGRDDYPTMPVPQLDREHSQIAMLASEFSEAVRAGTARGELHALLTRLIGAFAGHFKNEEQLMRSTGYPSCAAHSVEHQELLTQMRDFRADLASGAICLCSALADYVHLWTERHILGADASFARFLDEAGIARPEQRSGQEQLPTGAA